MKETSMFGKTYNTIGSTDSNFLIKTKGDFKVLWGGKYIDIVKNGKLASAGSNILKTVSTSDDISGNGIFLIPTKEEVWVSIDGVKINLTEETTYVSFLTEQKEVTADLKYTALTNIGFYYETLEEALSAEIKAGLVFIPSEQKLYLVKDGKFTDYLLVLPSLTLDNSHNNTFDEIIVGDLKIFNSSGYSKLDSSTRLMLSINGELYIAIKDKIIFLSKTLWVEDDVIILSVGADSDKGFRLYNTSNGSVLEVDSIVWRNLSIELPNLTLRIDSSTIFSEHNNIILSSLVISEENDESLISCFLKYANNFLEGQLVYVFLSLEVELYVITIDSYVEELGGIITVSLKNGKLAPEPISINILYNEGQEITITLALGENYTSVNLGSLKLIDIDSTTILSGPNNLIFEGEKSDTIYFDKASPYECKINSVKDLEVVLSVPAQFSETFINSCYNTIICVSNTLLLEIKENNINVLDRSKTTIGAETDETIHTIIGVVEESDFESLKECPEELEEVSVGIYSDNFIGLNSKLYDTIFKKRCDYPKYDESVEIPKDVKDEKYDLNIPNIAWIKELIKLAVPKGTIAMFNGGSEIPEGWAICDGTNGTPNLVGKFIKAVSSTSEIGENDSELNLNNELVLTKEHLPSHNHPHLPHTHSLSGESLGFTDYSGNLSVGFDWADYNWGISSTSQSVVTSVSGEGVTSDYGIVDSVSNINTLGGTASGGDHRHSFSLSEMSVSEETSLEDKTIQWENKPIKIEPRSYSLVFIMKL